MNERGGGARGKGKERTKKNGASLGERSRKKKALAAIESKCPTYNADGHSLDTEGSRHHAPGLLWKAAGGTSGPRA